MFASSALKAITIPSTLTEIDPTVFEGCADIKRIEFLEGREVLGKNEEDACAWNKIFRSNKVERVVLPSTLKEISLGAFKDCDVLKVVRIANSRGSDQLTGNSAKAQENE